MALDRHIKTFAEAVQKQFDQDVKYRLVAGSRREASGASIDLVLMRTKYLHLAMKNAGGVQMAAEQLAAALLAVWLVGDESAENLQLPLPGVIQSDGTVLETKAELDQAAAEQGVDVSASTLPSLPGENPPEGRRRRAPLSETQHA